MIKILNGWLRTAFLVFDLASLDGCTMGEEAALWGRYGLVPDCQVRTGKIEFQICLIPLEKIHNHTVKITKFMQLNPGN